MTSDIEIWFWRRSFRSYYAFTTKPDIISGQLSNSQIFIGGYDCYGLLYRQIQFVLYVEFITRK